MIWRTMGSRPELQGAILCLARLEHCSVVLGQIVKVGLEMQTDRLKLGDACMQHSRG